jgi:hypothetical protein
LLKILNSKLQELLVSKLTTCLLNVGIYLVLHKLKPKQITKVRKSMLLKISEFFYLVLRALNNQEHLEGPIVF